MCTDEILFGSICCFSFISINYSFILTFIVWINIGFKFGLKVIFRIWRFRGKSKHLIFNFSYENIFDHTYSFWDISILLF